MIIISGIDGVLCPSIFTNDGSQDEESPEFQAQLLAVPLLPWVTVSLPNMYQKARIVIFVTRRGVHLNNITTTWVAERLHIHSFRIVNLGFTASHQYFDERRAFFDEAINQCMKARETFNENIHVLEEDPAILDYIVEMAKCLAGVVVYAIRDGELCIEYP